jgi:hypothetical protein
MIRVISVAVAVGVSVAAARPGPDTPAPACLLLVAPEASKLLGMPVVVNPDDVKRLDFSCRYNPPNAGPLSFDGVEITWRTFSDGNTAHAYFPKWVIPVPPKPADMTLIPVTGVGDEATVVHGAIINGIYFRRGAVLVKVGTHPAASDTALQTAGKIIVGRL